MTTLHIDPERVVHETIDGETLLIHLASGTYFSLRESGAEIWELLVARRLRRAGRRRARRTPARRRRRRSSPRSGASRRSWSTTTSWSADLGPPCPLRLRRGAAQRQAVFVPPVLEKYTDMQYFLMLDPIHEVDDAAGWPTPAPATGPPTTV